MVLKNEGLHVPEAGRKYWFLVKSPSSKYPFILFKRHFCNLVHPIWVGYFKKGLYHMFVPIIKMLKNATYYKSCSVQKKAAQGRDNSYLFAYYPESKI